MAIHPAARQQPDSGSVPALELMPRLEPAGDGGGASIRVGAGIGLRVGLIALLGTAIAAAAAFLLTHRSHHLAGRTAAAVSARPWDRAAARAAAAGVRSTSAAVLGSVSAVVDQPRQATQLQPVPHYLSAGELTSVADGASLYQPPGYLADAYRSVGARYHIPWRVLASLEYIEGGYVDAIAGASARAERSAAAQAQAGGRDVVNAHVLAQATAAAAQPSAALIGDARRLAADGADRSPGQGLMTFMSGTDSSAQSVLTLAESIAPAASTASSPLAKVSAMLNEARLLNGLPYVWGGGHTNPAWVVGAGYDCSGFVSEVLHAAGYLNSPDTTQTLPGSPGIVNGRGRYVTIYDRTIATLKIWVKKRKTVTIRKAVNPATIGVHVTRGRRADSLNSVSITLPKWVGEWKTIRITKLVPSQDTSNNDEHVIIDINGHWWESGGSSTDGGAAMVHPITDPSPAYLKSFNRVLHPQGL